MSSYDWSAYVPGPHEIETVTGKYVDLANPRPECIDLTSVASGLSNTCRYNGQVPFYSVAQHAVMVSRRLERQGFDAEFQLAGLHHDDAEAFLGDVTRPLKSLFQPTYENLTIRMDVAICRALALPFDASSFSYPVVKAADNWALLIEAHYLLPSHGVNWQGSDLNGITREEILGRDHTDGDLWEGVGFTPSEARYSWLKRHYELMFEIDDIEDARKAIRESV